jgi:alkyldihydroxyacetonephosphate synthase
VLVLGFESADHPLEAWMRRALECCAAAGGDVPAGAGETRRTAGESGGGDREGAAGAWRNAFLRGPYVRDALAPWALVSETFETAITWDRFADFHARVMAATQDAVRRVCGTGSVSCRFTHAYPDGPAPYYSISAPSRHGSELAQWAEIKAAASEALIAAGGTITHHHAVGRDHRPWYEREVPALFLGALRSAKASLDPRAILNPGVLFDPAV